MSPHNINKDPFDGGVDSLILKAINGAEPCRRPALIRIAEWLGEHCSKGRIINATQASWSEFGPPLDEWAQKVFDVNLVISKSRIQIKLLLRSSRVPFVCQSPPMNRMHALEFTCTVPDAIRNSVGRLMMCCPSISVRGEGMLADEHFFATPLRTIDLWHSSAPPGRERVLVSGSGFPFKGELLETYLGDLYLYDNNGKMYFFDHEECEYFSCSVDVDTLVCMYLSDPNSIIDPEKNGWVT